MQRRAQHAQGAAAGEGEGEDDLVRLLHDAIERLGVTVRIEPMPEEAHLAGGYCRVHGTPALFLSPTASVAEQRAALLEALRMIGTEHVWLPPALRKLVESR